MRFLAIWTCLDRCDDCFLKIYVDSEPGNRWFGQVRPPKCAFHFSIGQAESKYFRPQSSNIVLFALFWVGVARFVLKMWPFQRRLEDFQWHPASILRTNDKMLICSKIDFRGSIEISTAPHFQENSKKSGNFVTFVDLILSRNTF